MPGALTRSKSLRFLTNNRKDTTKHRDEQSKPSREPPSNNAEELQPAIHASREKARCQTPDVAIRPTTSGEPAEPATRFQTKTIAASSIPSPAQEPSFPSYPSFHSFSNSTATLSRVVTTEEQGHIGIALGSPTVGSHWVSTLHKSDATTMPFQQSNGSSVAINNPQVAPKSKRSKWRALFKKAAPPPALDKSSFYQVTTMAMSATPRVDSHHYQESEALPASLQEETRVRKAVPPAYRPAIRTSHQSAPEDLVSPRSQPELPLARQRALTLGTPRSASPSAMSIQSSLASPLPPPKDTLSDTKERPKHSISGRTGYASAPGSGARLNEKALLDVNIPDITLERYSVMFGTVLQSSAQPSSSLLERRQANAEKIKPLSKLSVQQNAQEVSIQFALPRRATSPAPTTSPQLSLFPPKHQSRAPSPLSISARPVQPLHRSKTAPAKSPVVQTFGQVAGLSVKESALNPSSPKPDDASSPHPTASITPTSIRSYGSETESVTISSGGQTHSTVQLDKREPTRPICQRPTAIPTPSMPSASPPLPSALQRQPQPINLSALSSHPSSTSLDAPSPLHRLRTLTQPLSSPPLIPANPCPSEAQPQRKDVQVRATRATMGIARSVSVSKANPARSVPVPPRTRSDPHKAQGERLVQKHVLTPTMVEVRSRKSHRVQLEMAG